MIHVVTAVSRPENIGKVVESVVSSMGELQFVHHFVLDRCSIDSLSNDYPHKLHRKDSSDVEKAGNAQCNFILDFLLSSYPANDRVLFLDDDNLLSPDVGITLTENDGAVYFSQYDKGEVIRTAEHGNARPGACDKAQIVMPLWMVGSERFLPVTLYEADGHFFERIVNKHAQDITLAPDRFVFYNKLREVD